MPERLRSGRVGLTHGRSDNNTAPPFWHQPAVERALTGARDQDRLSRSYLFFGPDGVGKWAAAMWVAKCLLCTETALVGRPCGTCDVCRRVDATTHPDCHVLFPIRKSTADEDIETFLTAKHVDPFAVVRFPSRANLAISLTLGGLITYVDTRPTWDDTGVTAAAILITCGVLGFSGPRRPWLWALAVGIWIPLLGIFRTQSYVTSLALVVALAGAYAGMALRKGLTVATDGTGH